MSDCLKQVREQSCRRGAESSTEMEEKGEGLRGRSITGSQRHRRASEARAEPMGTEQQMTERKQQGGAARPGNIRLGLLR